MLRFDRVWLAGAVSLGFCLGVLPVASIASAQETLSQSDRNVLVKGATDDDFITSPSAQDPHGVRVCDLNGDGYGDLVVGAPRYSPYGRVYVVFGEEGLSDSSWDLLSDADFTVKGSSASTEISGSLACGDVNGDSIEDLVIGAPEAGTYGGLVYVVFGSASLSGDLDLASDSADITVTGSGGAGQLGRDVVVADFNDDGIGDLVIGEPGADPDPDGLGART
ncbi:MAG: integrin alpha, partial [Myxococcota bacterium]